MGSYGWISGWSRRAVTRVGAVVGVLSLGALALAAVPVAGAATAATTAPPYTCARTGRAGSQTVYGTYGDASAIGWAGNSQGVVACLGGSFWVDTSGPARGPGRRHTAPGSGTTQRSGGLR